MANRSAKAWIAALAGAAETVAGTGCPASPFDDGCAGVITEVGPNEDPGGVGFTEADAHAELDGAWTADLLWVDGSATTLTLTLADRGPSVWIEADPADAVTEVCPDPYYIVPFTATVVSADGRLDTEWAFDQNIGSLGFHQLRGEFVGSAMRGSWVPVAATLEVSLRSEPATTAEGPSRAMVGSLTEWVEVEGSGGVQSPQNAATIGITGG